MSEKTPKELEEFEIILPAKRLHESIIKQTKALEMKAMNENRLKELNLAIKSLNSFIRAYGIKISYFRLSSIPRKIQIVKQFSKRLKKK